MTKDLFEHVVAQDRAAEMPLAARVRPTSIDIFAGHAEWVGEGAPLRAALERDEVWSVVLWGPPGTGKTTLARIAATMTKRRFIELSAVSAGVRDVRTVIDQASDDRQLHAKRTLVFLDEIHRFNKAQQDAFLPYVERGDIILIGATTENPSFEVISALLSRCRVHILRALTVEEIVTLLQGALGDKDRGVGDSGIQVSNELLERMALFSNGDARAALQTLETTVVSAKDSKITEELLASVLERKILRYDKAGEEHFNLISALHKSVRSSDPDAALYWLTRMLESGEDRLYVGRRLVRMAFEDIGLADPRALEQAMAAVDAFRFIGEPEGDLALAQVVVYLAMAPKSDSVYRALGQVKEDVRDTMAEPVPMNLRNAPTDSMKDWGYGEGYEHAHQFSDAVTGMDCLPDSLRGRRYYHPTDHGIEKRIAERLHALLKTKEAKRRE